MKIDEVSKFLQMPLTIAVGLARAGFFGFSSKSGHFKRQAVLDFEKYGAQWNPKLPQRLMPEGIDPVVPGWENPPLHTRTRYRISPDKDDYSKPWLIINFGRRVTGIYGGQGLFEHVLEEFVQVILNANEDFFLAANNLKNEIQASEYTKIFEAKPGIFGFSIDLFHAGTILNKIYKRMRSSKAKGKPLHLQGPGDKTPPGL